MVRPVILFVALSILLSFKTHAAETFNLQHLQSLFVTYKRQAAYDYALQYIKQMEGDPYFDYFYGVSAIDTGHASEGVFALERVLLFHPSDHVARLELARGYFILEEYARSRQEFEKVMAINPPPKVKQTAEAYLDNIRRKEARYRTTTNGYVELAMGSDSNVNGGANADELVLVALNEESLEQDDTFSSLTASWQISHPFKPGWMLDGAITANSKINSELDQYDSTTGSLQFGLTQLQKYNRFRYVFITQQFNLDSEKYRNLNAFNFEWHKALSQESNITTTLQYAVLDYTDQEYRNSALSTLSLGYTHNFSGSLSPSFFSILNIGTEMPELDADANAQANVERDIWGIKLGIGLNFSPKLALQASTGLQNSAYDDYQTFPAYNTIIRDDDYVTVDAQLLWLFYKQWRLDTKLSYSDNRSNVEIHNHDRTIISLNLNYAF
ncbi:MAG: surface lipoprotein assembly modifier [Gammaproteobacteria bacterium]